MGVIVRTSRAPRAGLTFDGAQQIPTGFRNTEVGLLPQEWSVRTLDELGQSLIGLTYDPRDIDPSGVLVLRSSNIGNNSLQFGDDVHVNMDIPDRMIARRDDLLICVRNGSRPLIGKCALIDERAAGMAFGAFMSVFRSADTRFVFHCFQSDIIKRQINEHLGATINQITNKSLNSFKIPYPEQQEREAITAALSDMDELLDALGALIAKKQNIKLSAMQRLLTGETRLPGYGDSWTLKPLIEIAQITMGQSPSSAFYNLSGDGYPLIQGNADIRDRRTFSRVWSTRGSKYCDEGDLILTVRAPVGAVAMATENSYLGRGVAGLKPFGTSGFLFHALVHAEARWQILEQGSTFTAANSKQVDEFRLYVPENEGERTAIAKLLTNMDTEIAALEQRRNKMIAIKQGIMQELLTGRTRLV